MYRKLLIALLCAVPISLSARQKTSIPDSVRSPKLVLSLTLLDFPYQKYATDTRHGNFLQSYANPSMSQSLYVSRSFFNAAHYGLKKVYDPIGKAFIKQAGFYAATSLIDFYLGYLPAANGWLHEEFHRSVMTRRRVNSYNGINDVPINAEAVSVSRVTDEDLARFKYAAPQDFIRMQVAGIEGEYLLVDRLQRDNFFNKQALPHEPLYWLTTLGAAGYVAFSSDPETVDVETKLMNAKEPNVRQRDFTGFDFSGWVYDLFRPGEPYTSRGIHPLGNGVDRYRKTTDLTGDELIYLKRMGRQQYLNVISPMLLGFRSITINGKKGIRGNFAIRNMLTSFGNDISLHVFGQYDKYNLVAIFHRASNYSSSFGAAELELVDYPVQMRNLKLLLSPKVILGTQPKDQVFKTNDSEFLGYGGLKLALGGKRNLQPFVDFYGKTDGWFAGNEFLNKTIGAQVGFSYVLLK